MENSDSAVYLIGSERSGTNLLRKRITENQDYYFGPSPSHFLKHLFYSTPYYNDLYDDQNFIKLIDFALELCYNHFAPWEISLNSKSVLIEYSKVYNKRNVILLAHFLMKKYAKFKGYQSYFCKDNHLYDFIFHVLYELPETKFIYLYRDPRDFAVSQLKRKLQTNNIVKVAELWKKEQTKCLAEVSLLKPNQVYLISYEEFITNEDTKIDEILDFLKIKRFYKKNVENFNPKVEEWENISKPTIQNNYNKYLCQLSSFKIKVIESICWFPMNKLGYKTISDSRPKFNHIFIKFFNVTYLLIDKITQYYIRKKPQYKWIVRRNKEISRYKYF